MTKTNAWLTIEGHQWSGDEPPDVMKLSTEGSIVRQADSWQIIYEESEATGLEGTRTTVQVEDSGAISLLRTGSHNMRLTFVEGTRHISRMETPYGNLDIGIYTSSARAELTESGGRIHLGYTIDFNNKEPMNTSLDIVIRKAGADGGKRPSATVGGNQPS